MKLLIIALSVLVLFSCDSQSFDGKIVIDSDGKMYRLKHNIGDTYFVKPIHDQQVESLRKFIKTK